MFPTGFGWVSPYACPGVTVTAAPDPNLAAQALRLTALLQGVAPTLEVLQSLITDLSAAPDTGVIPGLWQFRQAFGRVSEGVVAARGAIRRILCGDSGAAPSLAVAGQILAQSLDIIRPQLQRLIMEAALAVRPRLEHLRDGIESLSHPLTQAVRAIETVVGPEAWGAARAPAGRISGYGTG